MLVKTYSSAVQGINASIVTIEVNIAQGVNFCIVGLPDSAVKESQQRIDAALRNLNFRIPGKRITINMAPADLRKEGSSYDLAIASGILAAAGDMRADRLGDYLLIGELSLDGGLQPVKGILSVAALAKEKGFRGMVLPMQNAEEAALVSEFEIYGINNLQQLITFFNDGEIPPQTEIEKKAVEKQEESVPDFCEVKGQSGIKRALEIAAAGGHNLILIGPPGSGKTMMARRLSGILPPLTVCEALETTKIHSIAGKLPGTEALIKNRPFRSPHHSITHTALIGGGSNPQPGEISLAHNGVLFLDELPEFHRHVLEVLRQPLEDRMIAISRSKMSVLYPASFMLVASMNPCPCGFYNHPTKKCHCPPGAIRSYLNKISGPLLDRIDIHAEVAPVSFRDLSAQEVSEKSSQILKRVLSARQLQAARFLSHPGMHCNAQMNSHLLRIHCQPDAEGKKILQQAMGRLGLSARAYDRILKVARSIADLDSCPLIRAPHLAEAIQYRSLDRADWTG